MKKFLTLVLAITCYVTMSAQAPDDWYHQDPADGYNGVSVDKTYSTLLKGRASQTVVVAIIDSGMDIEHEDLADNMWVNPGEIPGNGIDDDNNGYIDDIHGWNFIGGKDGSHVGGDNLEVTRQYAKYRGKFGKVSNPEKLSKDDKVLYEKFLVYKEEVETARKRAMSRVARMDSIGTELALAIDAAANSIGSDTMTVDAVNAIDAGSDSKLAMAKRVIPQFLSEPMTPER